MIGQSQVTDPLMTALRTGRVGHAYLFSGPRGCGKTTSARILARCLNCAEGPTDTPCGVCPSCVELGRDGGGSLDVVEIDAASHGGVDDARDLRERAVFAPARDRFKIFIIDEAHMVTAGGFNALLKIVEEPPPHVKFIFATTEPEKVIGTIRSRTHHYPFRLIAPGTLIDYVQQLCDSEGVEIEPGVLPLVVRSGGGSVRDTLSILDQLIAGSEGNRVSLERAAGLLGFTHTELLDDVVAALGAQDAGAAFQATDRVVQTGQDPRRFVEDLLERLRDLIVVGATSVDGAAAVFRGVPQDQLDRMFEQSSSFGPGELSRLADVVSAGLDAMSGATAPRMQLELMIARALVQAGEPAAGGAQRGAVPQGAAPQRTLPQQAAQQQAAPHGQAAQTGAPRADAPQRSQQVPQGAQSVPPQPAPAQPAGAPGAAQQRPAPTAAETAASIREFLRGEGASAAGNAPQGAPAAETRATPTAEAEAPEGPQQQGPTPGQGAAEGRVEAPGGEQPEPVRPAQAASQETQGERHPNEGAAGFGRPISDVLSAAQIESIGTEKPAPAPAPAAPQPSAPAEQRPAPQAGAPEAAPAAPEASQAPAASPHTAGGPAEASTDPVEEADDQSEVGGFDDLLEVWPDLLEEILEQDRDAWNAVKNVVPLSLDGEILSLGFANGSDLAVFKTTGAGPLREAISSTVGMSVKYQPKQLPAGASAGAHPGAGAAAAPREHSRSSEAEEPDLAASEDPLQRAERRLSAFGPALAAPAWADPNPPQSPAPERMTAAELADAAPRQKRADGTPGAPAAAGSPGTPAPDPTADPTSAGTAAGPGSGAEVGGEFAPGVPARSATSEANGPDGPSGIPGGEAPAAPAAQPRQDGADAPSAPAAASERVPPQSTPSGAPSGSARDFDDPYAGDPNAGEPSDDGEGDPYGSADPYGGGDPYSTPGRTESSAPAAPSGPAATVPAPAALAQGAPAPAETAPAPAAPGAAKPAEPAQPRAAAPKFTRYGEAVVREVLGARFVEERPLPRQ
ncbi:DNA polymerase III subunit gamma and tau [Leucobacter sp. CSA2]